MTLIRNPKLPEEDKVERRLIRVDCPSAQAGIAAALRRAFRAPLVVDHDDVYFTELLKRLH